MRAKVRQEFERNRNIDDLETFDIVLLKGSQEYQETMNCVRPCLLPALLYKLIIRAVEDGESCLEVVREGGSSWYGWNNIRDSMLTSSYSQAGELLGQVL